MHGLWQRTQRKLADKQTQLAVWAANRDLRLFCKSFFRLIYSSSKVSPCWVKTTKACTQIITKPIPSMAMKLRTSSTTANCFVINSTHTFSYNHLRLRKPKEDPWHHDIKLMAHEWACGKHLLWDFAYSNSEGGSAVLTNLKPSLDRSGHGFSDQLLILFHVQLFITLPWSYGQDKQSKILLEKRESFNFLLYLHHVASLDLIWFDHISPCGIYLLDMTMALVIWPCILQLCIQVAIQVCGFEDASHLFRAQCDAQCLQHSLQLVAFDKASQKESCWLRSW